MKQILTILVTLGAMSLASATASASLTAGDVLELDARPTTTTLNARDALGIVAQCYGGYGGGSVYHGGGYGGYGYAPVRRSYYRGGGGGVNISYGRSYGGFGGSPYGGRGYGGRGYGGRGYGGRGYGRGGSGIGLFLSF